MSYWSVIGVASQAVLIPWASRYYSDKNIVVAGCGIIAASYILFALVRSKPQLFGAVTIMSMSQSLVKTVMAGKGFVVGWDERGRHQ